VTLATKVAILALAGVGLNLALGLGGLISFGHAAFFGIGGYVTGIFAIHAVNATPVTTLPFTVPGTNEMLAIWPVAILFSGLAALVIGALSLRTSGVYFIMVTLAFAQMLYYFAISWPAYGGEDGLSFFVSNTFPGLNTLRRSTTSSCASRPAAGPCLSSRRHRAERASGWRCRRSARTGGGRSRWGSARSRCS
jgi:branched-chain amino acid transport system permease protein